MFKGGDVDDPDKLADKLTNKVLESQKKQSVLNMDIILEEQRKESNVGKMLTDFTLRKVIFIVLLMLFTNPLFMVQTYVTEPNSFVDGLNFLMQAEVTTNTALK